MPSRSRVKTHPILHSTLPNIPVENQPGFLSENYKKRRVFSSVSREGDPEESVASPAKDSGKIAASEEASKRAPSGRGIRTSNDRAWRVDEGRATGDSSPPRTCPADNRANGASREPFKKVEDNLEVNDSQRSGSESRLSEVEGTMSGVKGVEGYRQPGRTSALRIVRIGVLAGHLGR
jgi:hypothetical protein